MALPVFIVCSEGGAIDRHSNQLSIYDVIERITFQDLDNPLGAEIEKRGLAIKPISFCEIRMTAYWRREEADADQEFDFRTTIHMPGAESPGTVGQGSFVFKADLHRLVATIYSNMPAKSGEITVVSAVKKSNADTWTEQKYVVPVEKIENKSTEPQ